MVSFRVVLSPCLRSHRCLLFCKTNGPYFSPCIVRLNYPISTWMEAQSIIEIFKVTRRLKWAEHKTLTLPHSWTRFLIDLPPLPNQGCQIFRGATYQNVKNEPNDHKYTKWTQIYQTDTNYQMTKIYQMNTNVPTLSTQGPPKYTQTGIFFVLK
jgi:hypothetical protein